MRAKNGLQTELLIFSRTNALTLAQKLRALRSNGKIKFTDLVVRCGICEEKGNQPQLAQQRLSRWLSACERRVAEGWKKLDSDDYRKIVEYLAENQKSLIRDADETKLEALYPGVVYHSMSQWLDMSERSLDDVRSHFPGTYTIYRHSLLVPGHVLIGSLEITCDTTKAVATVERYHIEDSELTPARDFELKGYLLRRNGKYRILAKETGTDELQYMYINAVERRGGIEKSRQIIRMSGILSDLQGHTFYSTRFCCVRAKPQKLTAVPLKGLKPESILIEIGQKPQVVGEGYIAIF